MKPNSARLSQSNCAGLKFGYPTTIGPDGMPGTGSATNEKILDIDSVLRFDGPVQSASVDWGAGIDGDLTTWGSFQESACVKHNCPS